MTQLLLLTWVTQYDLIKYIPGAPVINTLYTYVHNADRIIYKG